MAIRLALLAHHYRADWEWTDDVLLEAAGRLGRWRAAVAPALSSRALSSPGTASLGTASPVPASPAAEAVLAKVRERLADDLDAPGAVAVIDAWAAAVTGEAAPPDAALVRDAADALLGVAL
jgi:L-cysteine:1D-myo-inositol 2-amino-2-deoxy-alpha-D-glucopyranoside ligase